MGATSNHLSPCLTHSQPYRDKARQVGIVRTWLGAERGCANWLEVQLELAADRKAGTGL